MTAPKLALKVAELEKQLVVLTGEVERLKEQVGNEAEPETPWWEKHWGIFDNDPDYEKAMELGRQYRESLRPKLKKRHGVKVKEKSGKSQKG